MFYDSTGDYAPQRTPEERIIYQKHMDESVRAKTYGEQVQADKKRDRALSKLPSYCRS